MKRIVVGLQTSKKWPLKLHLEDFINLQSRSLSRSTIQYCGVWIWIAIGKYFKAFVYTSLAHSMDQFGTKTENTRMAKITFWADLILKWLNFANTDGQMLSLYGQTSRGRGRGSKCRFMQTLCPIYPHWHLSIFIYFNVYILTFLRLGNMRQECPGPSLKVRLVLVKYNYVFFGCLSDPRAIVVLLCP